MHAVCFKRKVLGLIRVQNECASDSQILTHEGARPLEATYFSIHMPIEPGKPGDGSFEVGEAYKEKGEAVGTRR